MPITTGFTSRSAITTERVQKYNPNHGPDGRFTSGSGGGGRGGRFSGGGRYSSADVARGSSGWATRPQDNGRFDKRSYYSKPGGTEGPPKTDAFGKPIKSKPVYTGKGRFDTPGGGWNPTQRSMDRGIDPGFIRGTGTFTGDPGFIRDTGKFTGDPGFIRDPIRGGDDRRYPSGHPKAGQWNTDPNYNQGEGDPEMAGSTGYRHALGTLPTVYPGSMIGGKPTKRSSFS